MRGGVHRAPDIPDALIDVIMAGRLSASPCGLSLRRKIETTDCTECTD